MKTGDCVLPFTYDALDYNVIKTLILRNMRRSGREFSLAFRQALNKNLSEILLRIPSNAPRYVQVRDSQLPYLDYEVRRELMLATVAENSKHIVDINDDQQTITDLLALSDQTSDLVKEVAVLQL